MKKTRGSNKCRRNQRRKQRIHVRLAEAQNWKCCYCGEVTWHPLMREQGPKLDHLRMTVEHVVTRSNGGSNEQDNAVMACSGCNNLRGSNPIEYMEKIVNSKYDKERLTADNNMRRKERRKLQNLKGTFLWLTILQIQPEYFWHIQNILESRNG